MSKLLQNAILRMHLLLLHISQRFFSVFLLSKVEEIILKADRISRVYLRAFERKILARFSAKQKNNKKEPRIFLLISENIQFLCATNREIDTKITIIMMIMLMAKCLCILLFINTFHLPVLSLFIYSLRFVQPLCECVLLVVTNHIKQHLQMYYNWFCLRDLLFVSLHLYVRFGVHSDALTFKSLRKRQSQKVAKMYRLLPANTDHIHTGCCLSK